MREIGLEVTDYTENAELHDAITRYYTVMRMSFDSQIYKIMETRRSQIYRYVKVNQPTQEVTPAQLAKATDMLANVNCPSCRQIIPLQLKFSKGVADKENKVQFPNDDKLKCPHCRADVNLSQMRRDIEVKTGRTILRKAEP